MEITSNVKYNKSHHLTSAPNEEDSWIQPSIVQQSVLIKNEKLIDGIYVQFLDTISDLLIADSELKEFENAALTDFWNLENTED